MDSTIQLLNNWGLNKRGSIYVNLLKISIPASEDARPVLPGPNCPKVINASPVLVNKTTHNYGLFTATLGFAALIFLQTTRFCGSRSEERRLYSQARFCRLNTVTKFNVYLLRCDKGKEQR